MKKSSGRVILAFALAVACTFLVPTALDLYVYYYQNRQASTIEIVLALVISLTALIFVIRDLFASRQSELEEQESAQ